jgi:regulator of sirC expression with transglutaminase-like and TPR domain
VVEEGVHGRPGRYRPGTGTVAAVEATERFEALLRGPEAAIALDEAALLVAAHAYPGLDLAAELGHLDELAARCREPTLPALVRHLFVDEGFRGNRGDYYDPRNSYLNDVVARRTGIPITLAVLALAVGRRIGVPVAGVSMPGHFLLRDRVDPDVFVDAFAGLLLDRRGCEALFRQVHGVEAELDEALLAPVGAHAVLARLLANLKGVFVQREDRDALLWVLRLRTLVPGVPAEERRELAGVLAAVGQVREAATEYEQLADVVERGGGDAGRHRRAALRLRARLN